MPKPPRLFALTLSACALHVHTASAQPWGRSPALVPPPPLASLAASRDALRSDPATPASAFRPAGSKLRVLLVALGTRGDVEPACALAAELARRGHAPLVLALDTHRAVVAEQYGLPFASAGLDAVPQGESYFSEAATPADQVRLDNWWFAPKWAAMGGAVHAAAAAHGAHAIATTVMGDAFALDAAEALNVTAWRMKFNPDVDGASPTVDFPAAGAPYAKLDAALPGWLAAARPGVNYASHVVERLRVIAGVVQGGYLKPEAELRADYLGLPSLQLPPWAALEALGGDQVPTFSPWRTALEAAQPALYAFSTALCARPGEYGGNKVVTGFWRRRPGAADAATALPVSEALRAFVARAAKDGAPVCAVCFGSMSCHGFAAPAARGARAAGMRVVVVGGGEGGGGGDGDDDGVAAVAATDYRWLFGKCAAVVHHGGSGTVASAAEEGCPQVVVPVLAFTDQTHWGRWVEGAGVGVRVGAGGAVPRSEDVEAAVREAVAPARAAAARALRERLAGERGVEVAAEALVEYVCCL